MDLSAFRNLFGDLQQCVCQILNEDEILQKMGAVFFAENSLDIEYEVKTALAKTGLACLVMTPKANYQGHNGIQQTFTCDELTLQIVENPVVNRPRLKRDGLQHGTAMDIAKQASDRLAGPQGGYFGKFTTKRLQEAAVDGLLVVTATFGCTVYETLSAVISGDLSGNWVEVPFVRMSELSDWIDDYLSTHVPVPEVSGYLPLSGGTMEGMLDLSVQPLRLGSWELHDDYTGTGLSVYDTDTGESYQFGGAESDFQVARKMDLTGQVDVPTKLSELSNDVGYITSAQVEPTEPTPSTTPDYYLNGSALKAYKAFSLRTYLISSQGLVENQKKWMELPQTGAPIVYFSGENPFLLSSVNDIIYNAELVYDYVQTFTYRVGGRPRIVSIYEYCWTGSNWYLIKNDDDLSGRLIYNRSTAAPLTYNIVFSNDRLSVSSADDQATIICTRDSTGSSTTGQPLAFQKDVVKLNNTSALTVTVPYDYGFTLQTPNGTPLMQTIDLNRTAINSLSTGNAEIGGDLVNWPDAGVDTTKLSAWNWMKTGDTSIGSIISGEHNAILGEVAEDYVSFNWLIQQGYVTSADISALTGDFLPLSGGQMSGDISWDYGGLGGPKIAGPYSPQQMLFQTTYGPDADKMVFLDFSRITESAGQRTIAYAEDVWGRDSTTLSVGTGGYKTEVDPGAVTIQRLNNGTLTKTMYNWDGLTYTISAEGGTPANYNLTYPLSGGTLATRQYVDAYLGDISALIHES